jgi:hypothetical protein
MSLWNWASNGPFIHPPNDTWVNIEQRWNDTDRRKPKDSENNLSQCHSVQHKSHTDWHGHQSELPQATNRLSYRAVHGADTNLLLKLLNTICSHKVVFLLLHKIFTTLRNVQNRTCRLLRDLYFTMNIFWGRLWSSICFIQSTIWFISFQNNQN